MLVEDILILYYSPQLFLKVWGIYTTHSRFNTLQHNQGPFAAPAYYINAVELCINTKACVCPALNMRGALLVEKIYGI